MTARHSTGDEVRGDRLKSPLRLLPSTVDLAKDREVVFDLAEGVQILYESTTEHPREYAVVLRVLRSDGWHAVVSADNSHADRHDVDDHHLHRYHQGEKGAPESLPFAVDDTNDAMYKIIRWMADNWEELCS